MAKNVDKDKARVILKLADSQKLFADDPIGTTIRDILEGKHKTYKYILVNALLAKAVNPQVDILCLQAGDNSEGAYDARSLCHEVLVPFEREFYNGSLGGSNEPFLNKPARAKKLSYDNPVRPGNDKKTLDKLIRLLGRIKTKAQALKYLSSSIAVMSDIYKSLEERYHLGELPTDKEGNVQAILDYVNLLATKPFGGKTCVLIVSTIEEYYWKDKGKTIPHKVNESGSSTKEIGDIDVFGNNGIVVSSIEIKDKIFSKEDVDHAIRKFTDAGIERSMFVYGKNAHFDRSEIFQVAARYGRAGYFCSIVYIMDYAKIRLTHMLYDITLTDFITQMLHSAKCINASCATIEWIKSAAIQIAKEEK